MDWSQFFTVIVQSTIVIVLIGTVLFIGSAAVAAIIEKRKK